MDKICKLYDFTGKVIIITGGAGAIGNAAAHLFAAQGANVVIADILEADAKRVAEEVTKESGKEALGLKVDSTKEEDLNYLVEETVAKFGKISGLLNNVGWGAATPLWGSDTDKLVKSYILNTVSAYNLTKLCVPYLEKEPGAAVVFSNSMVGSTPSPEFLEYSTAKAALLNMARSMAVASGPAIRFNSIIIGSVDNGDSTLKAGYDPEMLRRISDVIVMKRRGKPEDIAQAMLFLMSDAASWITGIDLKIDGGGRYESKMPKK